MTEVATDYPHAEIPPKYWSPVKLYSVAGWMSSWYNINVSAYNEDPSLETEVATAFGGYFSAQEDTVDEREILVIRGQFVDTWGQSTIQGTMIDQRLSFTKKYRRKTDLIEYSLQQDPDQKGFYKGEFRHDASGRGGLVECRTTLVHDNAFGMVIGPRRIE